MLARDTYMEALSAAMYARPARRARRGGGGRTGDPARPPPTTTRERARDLILRGQALLAAEGQEAALPTVRRALRAFLDQPPDALELHWMWFGGLAGEDLWDAKALRTLAERQVELARAAGVLTRAAHRPQHADGRPDVRRPAGRRRGHLRRDRRDPGRHRPPLPKYGRIFVAAYRGQVDEVERRAKELRADAHARGEGYALTVANFSLAIVYNGAGRYADALAAGREELPYTHELSHAMRALLEIVEAASRTGERALAEQALENLAGVTRPVGDSNWALRDDGDGRGPAARGGRGRGALPGGDRPLRARAGADAWGARQLLYGEMLRRQGRRVDARAQLRAAHEVLTRCGMTGFAQRAARELRRDGGDRAHARSRRDRSSSPSRSSTSRGWPATG